jgi:hypothetical protein
LFLNGARALKARNSINLESKVQKPSEEIQRFNEEGSIYDDVAYCIVSYSVR